MRRLRLLLIAVLALPSATVWADNLLDLLPKGSTKLDYTYQYADIDVQPTRGIWSSGTMEIYVPGKAMSMGEMAKIRSALKPKSANHNIPIVAVPPIEVIPPKIGRIELEETITNSFGDIKVGVDLEVVIDSGPLNEVLAVQNGQEAQADTATDVYPVPEPITVALLGLGGLRVLSRRRK